MGRIVLSELSRSSRDLNEPEDRRRELWRTFQQRSEELDGHMWICVSSTGIYCRPTCHAQRPKFENCVFVSSAEEAEALGFRPCLRCRPELAPGVRRVGEEDDLAWRAVSLIREFCSERIDAQWAAGKLGVAVDALEKGLREQRAAGFEQCLMTARLLLAKQLLTDTRIDVERVAAACGFEDAKSMAAAMKERYRLEPVACRKRRIAAAPQGLFELRLSYRRPYGWDDLLEFFRMRELGGVERVDDGGYSRTARIVGVDGAEHVGWLRVEDDPARQCLRLTASESLLPVASQLIARVRRQFDLDCDPRVVHGALAPLEGVVPGANVAGTRVPGAFDSFEIAVRAVLGQQVSVKAANKLAARIADRHGKPALSEAEGLTRLFPRAEDFLAMGSIEDALGTLGVIKTRSRTIRELARLAVSGELWLNPAADVSEQMRRLLAVKGIGVWSQNYLAMRTLCYSDAFLEADSGVKHALPGLGPKERSAAVEPCRPWRAYANLCLWNSLAAA